LGCVLSCETEMHGDFSSPVGVSKYIFVQRRASVERKFTRQQLVVDMVLQAYAT
jgi:hypothetical protein